MTDQTSHADVLVVGGGPAGLATAIELRRRGAWRVVVLDRDEAIGGVPRYTHHAGYGLRDLHRMLTGPAYARRYAELAQRAGVHLHTSVTVTGWAGPASMEATTPDGVTRWQARAVVLATGCRERPRTARLVPGDRPAGVLTTGSLQQFADLYRLPIGCRAVVIGAEHVSFSAVHTLIRHGVDVVAVVTDLPQPQTYRALQLATAGLHRVPVITRATVAAIAGHRRVSGITLRHPDGRLQNIACDTVVFTGDWVAEHDLARRARLPVDAARGPATDQWLRTPTPGVFAVGNLVHAAETADVAACTGRHAASAVAAYLDGAPWPVAPAPAMRTASPIRWVFPALLQPGAGTPPRGRLLLRVDEILAAARLEVRQGNRTLYAQARRRIVPNRSISLPADWLAALDPGGEAPLITVAR